MDTDAVQAFRRSRLKELMDQKFEGKKVALGRALGHSSGAFVRQMIDGERPITEKTVAQVEQMKGCRGWFRSDIDHMLPTAAAVPMELDNLLIVSAEENAAHGFAWVIDRIADLIATMPPEQRAKASRLLARMADSPDSRIARNEVVQALISDTPSVPTWRDAAVELITEIRMRETPIDPETLIRDIDAVHSDRLSRLSAKSAQRTLTES